MTGDRLDPASRALMGCQFPVAKISKMQWPWKLLARPLHIHRTGDARSGACAANIAKGIRDHNVFTFWYVPHKGRLATSTRGV